MRFVLILIAALTVCAQAAPQFNKFNLRDWVSLDILLQDQSQTNNNNRDQNKGHNAFPSQSTFTRRRYPNDHGQEVNKDYEGSSGQCWDPVYHIYRDWSTSRPPSQHYNDNFQTQTNYYPHHHSEDRWRGPQAPHGPPHHHGHGPPSHHHGHGPPSHYHDHGPRPHHHEHGPPPHYHGHGTPSHHHGHGPPPHHHGYEPLPPRPPHRPPNEHAHYELQLCEDSSREKVVSEKLESSTSGDSVDVVTVSTSPVPSTSAKPKDTENMEPVTQSTIDSSVTVTTEFDWNNFYVDGATVDNTGGAGVIDVRIGSAPAV